MLPQASWRISGWARNLIDNAVKFMPKGGRVELSLYRDCNEGVTRTISPVPNCVAEIAGRRAAV
jgi:hypothetical protein